MAAITEDVDDDVFIILQLIQCLENFCFENLHFFPLEVFAVFFCRQQLCKRSIIILQKQEDLFQRR